MRPWLLLAALPLLGGCVSLADIGEDPYAPRYQQSGYPGWWGQDAASVNIFLGSLGPYGYWDRHPGLGQVWFPRGLAPGWQPYSRGHWVNDPRYGRRWVSYDPFGFATDHYGRWSRDPARGWYWIPGTRFQPGWTRAPQGWRPPAANHPGWRPPAANHPGWRPPADTVYGTAPGRQGDLTRATRDQRQGGDALRGQRLPPAARAERRQAAPSAPRQQISAPARPASAARPARPAPPPARPAPRSSPRDITGPVADD